MITIVIPYFNQPLMYQKQLDSLKDCPLKVIFVDDCSYEPIRQVEPYKYYRIIEDKGINWQGAKNLGVLMSDTKWVLMIDIDHVVPAETVAWLEENIGNLNDKKAYRFKRRLMGREIKPHSNSFLITKENFLSKGGYDLRFQGTKGGELYLTSQLNFGKLPVYLETYSKDEIKDAMTPEDDRDLRFRRYSEYKKLPKQPLINFQYV